ncbi:hypothetical protein P152DRAFT_447763 [Eremomyces bilateralis CBS 781.70]|uniref:Uncharacterized protein n=1 Tax=Eremomyces bilateralis CBS 781.70 TaxID=1392243 RepID=A0A6G1G8Z1_9PEZI|nr:uncharacterized protein P152DRAFT_447763 [Eremomyces bilateralis CBS 781.70]KAF1814396.1 hypothetical protein P152DRAFT_447763 [Eremomyces bilateralis CBS 781.70]
MGLPVWKAPVPVDTAKARADASVAQRSPIRRRRSPQVSRAAPHRRVHVASGTISGSATERSRRPYDPRSAWTSLDELQNFQHSSGANLAQLLRSTAVSFGDAQDRDTYRQLAESRLDARQRLHVASLPPAEISGQDSQTSTSRSTPFGYPDDFPPLRRMSGRSVNDLADPSGREETQVPGNSSRARVDGLGDRERSLPPDEDSWETMLTTITPDPHPPSAGSSFTTAVATASFSGARPESNPREGSDSRSQSNSRSNSTSYSARSSQTHLTVPFNQSSEDEEPLPEHSRRSDRRQPPPVPSYRVRHYTTDSVSDCDQDTDIDGDTNPLPSGNPSFRDQSTAPLDPLRSQPSSMPPRAPTAPPRLHPLDTVAFDAPHNLRTRREPHVGLIPHAQDPTDGPERIHFAPDAYGFHSRPPRILPGSRSPMPAHTDALHYLPPAQRPLSPRTVRRSHAMDRDRARRRQRPHVVTEQDVIDGMRADPEFAAPEDLMDPDLEEVQSVLARLAQREDIDDEWWIRAGLRDLVGRLGTTGRF